MLSNVTKFLMHNIGNRFSAAKIANTMKSNGNNVDQKTVSKYVEGLTECLMLYETKRYNVKGRQILTQQNKYYAADIGLRNILVQNKESDIGHLLENVVFLELLRRGYEVYVGQYDDGSEIDFVALDGDKITYYQVSATTLDEHTLERELAPLKKTQDDFPKYLLTLDEIFREVNYGGIQKKNVIDWLLEETAVIEMVHGEVHEN